MSSTTITSRPLALVTGASSGIGLELALVLAGEGHDLVIAAQDAEISVAAGRLRAAGAHVDALQVDLASDDGVQELARRVRASAKSLEVAVFNAGVGAGGRFVGGTDPARETAIIDLNVRATVHLAKRLVPDMAERSAGRILITAAAPVPEPGLYAAVYLGAGAFLQAFAAALGTELADSGVSVTALLAGPTDTPFFARAGITEPPLAEEGEHDPALVAQEAFAALMRGDATVTAPAVRSRAQELASRAGEGLRARFGNLRSDS